MRRAALIPALLLLAGCATGPDYRRPLPPGGSAPQSFVDPGLTRVLPGPAEGQWWRLFRDPVLDRLVRDALAHNPDVRAASANLRRARAIVRETRAGRFPTGEVSAGYTRQRLGSEQAQASGAPDGTVEDSEFDFFTAGLDASYELDLFGRVGRAIEASRADAAAAEAALDAARVSIAAETARTYAQACGFAAQGQVARETAQLQDRTLALTRRLFEAGRGTRREVDQATVLAENARAQAPTFEGERRAALYALATLTGRPPAELDADASRCAAPPAVATLIPVGDGAALLARRADVREAERRLAADTARIGVATAALYPSIRLLGSISLGAADIGDLGSASSLNYSLGPLISWSFANLGVARARIAQAQAGADESLARFDAAVLTALREVEQALARYASALEANASLRRAESAASNAARIAELRFTSGRDSFLQRLDAERERAAARAALARSDADIAEAQVALFKALGGGWEGAVQPTRLAAPAQGR
ncbi:MAG: efflux transporter outer membrane subunit [Novosphingobium sp.]